jgi:2',3'-cyclic-nucleotide 2'-phosphodiesterase (5'-nucleotidase family)
MTFVEKVRTGGEPVLVVDAGHLFFDTGQPADPKQALPVARLISRAYRKMGVAAVNVGDKDLLYGIKFLQQEASQGLPLISANLIDPSTNLPFFPPYIIKNIINIRIAFFGLLAPEMEPAVQKAAAGSIVVKDPVKTTRKIMKSLEGRADFVVLLSDLGLEREREVIRAAPGIHFVLGGHEGRLLSSPITEGQTVVLQASHKGMYAGKLRLIVENQSFPFRDEGRDDRIKRQISELDTRLQTLKQTRNTTQNRDLLSIAEEIGKQKAQFQKELQLSGISSAGSNRFLWTIVPLDSSFTEDGEVAAWIRDIKP